MRAAIRTLLLATLSVAPLPALSEDLAMIFANPVYSQFADPPGIAEVAALQQDFRRAGYRVQLIQNTGRDATPAQAEALWNQMKGADRLVLVFAGHILGTRDHTWLLHSDGGPMAAAAIGGQALPIQPFFDLLDDRPGEALLIIADAERPIKKGVGVVDKPTVRDVPQGVTLVHGDALPVAQFVATELLRPGRSLHAASRNTPDGVRMTGFLSRSAGLVLAAAPPAPQGSAEDRMWAQAQQSNTVAAYDLYLSTYPFGRYASIAQERRAELSLTPSDRARLAEEALGLSRDQRRAIQRQLTLLGYDTRGVDGILGRNSRNAIAAWQRSVGVPAFGYLTANQIARIEAAAAVRAEELRREAEERRQREEARDRDFWARTGASGREADLREYLSRYPDGIFSGTANEQLRAIERQRRREAQATERQAWDKAVMLGTIDSYENYLGTYPRGFFADEARARIASLRQPEVPPQVVAEAKAEEERLGLTAITRTLIERQLQALNLDPGRTDGKFTADTRRALRQFQRINNVVPTGFVTRQTVVLLLASAAQ
jgi:peptidoglycan hydrolase-like protein with peptidoglycan-binding domain